MRLDIDLNLFLTEHNDKAIMLFSACYVNCSKFNSNFDKLYNELHKIGSRVLSVIALSLGLFQLCNPK